MFKIALNAGHGFNTPGKRCLKAIDPNETREYTLNRRICDKLALLLSSYEGISILRIDDGSEISVSQRAEKANKFGAKLYLSVHHNAGINGGSGGGIEVYTYPGVDSETLEWQKLFYESLIAKTSLSGNRANPIKSADFGELRETFMPAVLCECGFMDSTTDTPIILTEAFADKAAAALCEAIAEGAMLKRKEPQEPAAKPTIADIAAEVIAGKWGNGSERKARLKKAGYDYKAIQKEVNARIKSSEKKSVAALALEVIAGKWGNGSERKTRLTAAGYSYRAVQKEVNRLIKKK